MWIIRNIDNQAACFLEMLLILLCIYGVFNVKFKFTMGNISLTIFNLLVMALIETELVGHGIAVVVYFILFVYCIKKFNRKFWETLGRFMLGLLLAGLIEIFTSIIGVLITSMLGMKKPIMMIVNMVGVLVAVLFFELLQKKREDMVQSLNEIHGWD